MNINKTKSDRRNVDVDMTPMVDVTFLLLVFFIVTASFTLQNSLAQEPVKDGSTLSPIEAHNVLQIFVDEDGNFELHNNQLGMESIGSLNELKRRLKSTFELTNTDLVIDAHANSTHQVVVSVWDMALQLGIKKIQIKSTDQTF